MSENIKKEEAKMLTNEIITVRFDARDISNKTYQVGSIEKGVELWEKFRDESGAGVSEIGNGLNVFQGKMHIANISYNGRVHPV